LEFKGISRRPDPNVTPLSFAQERFWFLDQLEPGNPAYNRPVALRLLGKLNVPTLEQTLSEIPRRHEVLRTTFPAQEGIPSQVIMPVGPVCLSLHDLRKFSAIERESQAIQSAKLEAKRPFDLAHGPLLRGMLLRLDDKEHILILITHQIVFDGWSARILIKEIAAIYEAFASGDRSPLVELPIQYGDFAYWQRQSFQEEIFRAQLSYWREKLPGHSPELHLPTDRPRPAIQTYLGSRQSLLLQPLLVKSLKSLGQREGVTLFMVLLAAFQTLLHRYTGQEDILVGSPIAGRTQVETEGLIGPFINTLVLRIDMSGNPPFLELLQRVRNMTLDAYMNQDLPFERLVKELRPDRDLSRTPFFQVMFNLENLPQKAAGIRNLEMEEFEFDSGATPFDLELEITDNAQGLSCFMSYNRDLFDSPTISRLLEHYQTLLRGLVNHPNQRLSELPLLTELERHQLLVEWNNTRVNYPKELCVHHFFEAQVRRTSTAAAVVFKDKQLTYAELNRKANQLAHYLQKRGVGPEVIVGICMERSLDMMVGLLAILKAGGAYLPLDHTYPADRIRFMLEDAGVPILLTQGRLAEDLPTHRCQVVRVDADRDVISREKEENVDSQATSQNLCYVIYTSGSTGKPKGVMVCHSNVVNFFAGMDERIPHDPPGAWLAVSSLSFDISVLELLWTLGRGFKTVLCPNEVWERASITSLASQLPAGNSRNQRSDAEKKEGYSISGQIKQHRVTHFQCTPSMANMLILDEESRSALTSVRTFIVGGESCSVALATKLRQMAMGEVINMYGPTETTIWSTAYSVGDEQNTVPIGRPIANTQVYILDKHSQPVPLGIAGELYIGGDGVTRGYLNRPDLTAERFIKNPFSDNPGSRLYRTGDLARYRQDGNIEFLGRMDHQVKIRGYRIELGEIETILREHSDVREAVVKEYGAEAGEVQLVAYVVSEREPPSLIPELRQFLQTKFPEHMIPS
jgi:non-ribosomal peptide synthetase component F